MILRIGVDVGVVVLFAAVLRFVYCVGAAVGFQQGLAFRMRADDD